MDIIRILSAAVGLFMLVAPAYGGVVQSYQDGIEVGLRAERLAKPGQRVIVAPNSLKGSTVVDPQRGALGRIDDVVVNPATGTISYIVLEPGTKDRLIPIPFPAFEITTGKQLVLDVDEGRIYTAPSYPKGGTPNWSDPVFHQRVKAFWGYLPSGVTMAPGK